MGYETYIKPLVDTCHGYGVAFYESMPCYVKTFIDNIAFYAGEAVNPIKNAFQYIQENLAVEKIHKYASEFFGFTSNTDSKGSASAFVDPAALVSSAESNSSAEKKADPLGSGSNTFKVAAEMLAASAGGDRPEIVVAEEENDGDDSVPSLLTGSPLSHHSGDSSASSNEDGRDFFAPDGFKHLATESSRRLSPTPEAGALAQRLDLAAVAAQLGGEARVEGVEGLRIKTAHHHADE